MHKQEKALNFHFLVLFGGLAEQAQQRLGVGIVFAIDEDLARRSIAILSNRAGVGPGVRTGHVLGVMSG